MKHKNLVNELKYIGILFIVAIIIFKIIFYKDNFVITLRSVFAIFYMFVIPGYLFMYYWHDKLEFLERFVIGTAIGVAFIGILSYYLGLIGFHIKYHAVLPLIVIIASWFFIRKKFS